MVSKTLYIYIYIFFFSILHILKKILPDCDYNLTNSLVNVNLFYDAVSVFYLRLFPPKVYLRYK